MLQKLDFRRGTDDATPQRGYSKSALSSSASDTADSDRSPYQYVREHIRGSTSALAISICDDASSITSRSRESYEQKLSPETHIGFQMEDTWQETGLTRLQINYYSSRSDGYSPGSTAGQKRHASKDPPRDDGHSLHIIGSVSDIFRRRKSASRASSIPRYHSTSGSVSSTISGPRSNSYASMYSLAASSITSMNLSAYRLLSPGSLSPTATDIAADSPRGSSSRATHQRVISETRPLITSRKLSDSMGVSKHSSNPKLQGVFICECCPKKPKKFDSQEELKYIPHFAFAHGPN